MINTPSLKIGDTIGDPLSLLFNNRYIYLSGEINDNSADNVITQLLALNAMDPDEDIYLVINSPGGVITSGLGIYNVMEYISNDIVTIGVGLAASMGAFLLAAGTKGKRFAFKDCKIMIHQPRGGMEGTASDIEIEANEMRKTKEKMNNYKFGFADNIKTIEELEKLTDRDTYLTSEEAMGYGFIDKIMSNQKDISEYLFKLNEERDEEENE